MSNLLFDFIKPYLSWKNSRILLTFLAARGIGPAERIFPPRCGVVDVAGGGVVVVKI